jgi:hypothetical protein
LCLGTPTRKVDVDVDRVFIYDDDDDSFFTIYFGSHKLYRFFIVFELFINIYLFLKEKIHQLSIKPSIYSFIHSLSIQIQKLPYIIESKDN